MEPSFPKGKTNWLTSKVIQHINVSHSRSHSYLASLFIPQTHITYYNLVADEHCCWNFCHKLFSKCPMQDWLYFCQLSRMEPNIMTISKQCLCLISLEGSHTHTHTHTHTHGKMINWTSVIFLQIWAWLKGHRVHSSSQLLTSKFPQIFYDCAKMFTVSSSVKLNCEIQNNM